MRRKEKRHLRSSLTPIPILNTVSVRGLEDQLTDTDMKAGHATIATNVWWHLENKSDAYLNKEHEHPILCKSYPNMNEYRSICLSLNQMCSFLLNFIWDVTRHMRLALDGRLLYPCPWSNPVRGWMRKKFTDRRWTCPDPTGGQRTWHVSTCKIMHGRLR